jgi:hypothetical protein
MQGGPVGEFLGVAVERPALDQLQVEVGRTAENRRQVKNASATNPST